MKRLSHSKSIVSLLGAQSDLKIDKTATGSVAEIRTQKSKHTKKGISNQTKGNIKNKSDDIIRADINNQKTARDVIVFQFMTNCL
ncbi:MAG: hypothetical protein P1U46_03680 [Patescibacteria group bacterium]|nr:hypothetical protein [Patescibacteria group bacterium]